VYLVGVPSDSVRGAGAAGAAAPPPALAAWGQRGGRKMPFCDVR